MIRKALLPLLLTSLVACPGGERGQGINAAVEIVGSGGMGQGFPEFPVLSPDGARLAYDAPVAGQNAIYVARPDGSDAVRITHGAWDATPRWSPDGNWIAYYSDVDGDIWAVPSAGGEARQLTSGPANDFPLQWLPDGSGVVFIRRGAGDVQTFVASLDGGAIRPLVPRPGNQWVVVSPDGSKAAYDLHVGGAGTIWVQDLPDGAARQLTTEGLENAVTENMWSPDGTHIAYVSQRTGTWDIWTADVATGALHQVTTDVRNDGYGFRLATYVWSPDSRWIAFVSDRGGQPDLWVVSAEGGEAMRLTNDLAYEGNVVWSPDGSSLYYMVSDQESEVQVMPVGGGTPRTLAGWPGYLANPQAVSPDGKTVLFWSNRSGNGDLWSVPMAGGEATPFAASPLEEAEAWYAPDGSQVVFESNRGGSWDLWVAPAAGGEARRLTDWPSGEYDAAWSPDGSMIAFESDHETSGNNIWVVPSTGGTPRQVTHDASVNNLKWSPDGQTIYYIGGSASGVRDLFRVPVAGGRPQALGASRGINHGDLSADGTQFAYSDFERSWAFLEVIPTAGGTPRRLATDTSLVYDIQPRWTPDGTRLMVGRFSYTTVSGGLSEVSWPDGAWRELAPQPKGHFVDSPLVTNDGSQVVFDVFTNSTRIMAASVAKLVGGGTEE